MNIIPANWAPTKAQWAQHEKARRIICTDKHLTGIRPALLSLLEVIDPACRSAATDAVRLFIGPWYFGLSLKAMTTVLVHECLHPLRRDHFRRGHREPRRWNTAADYVIGERIACLISAGAPLIAQDSPELDGLRDSRFDRQAAEEIYASLPAEPQQGEPKPGEGEGEGEGEPQPGEGEGEGEPKPGEGEGEGEGKPRPGKGKGKGQGRGQGMAGDIRQPATTDEAGEPLAPGELEKKWEEVARRAVRDSQRIRGKEAAGDRELADSLKKPPNWREVLADLLVKSGEPDSNWARPNRRTAGLGIYLPSWEQEESFPAVGVVVDSSGSMGCEEVARAMNSVHALAMQSGSGVVVVGCSTRAKHMVTLAAGDPMPKGMRFPDGGSDMRPGFTLVEEKAAEAGLTLAAIVYIGDGAADFPDREPAAQVIGILTGCWRGSRAPKYARAWAPID